jgi:hypothetical protein
MAHHKRKTNFIWLKTTNEVGVNGADDEHED